MNTETAALYAANLAATDLDDLTRTRDSLGRCIARAYLKGEHENVALMAERFKMVEDEHERRWAARHAG